MKNETFFQKRTRFPDLFLYFFSSCNVAPTSSTCMQYRHTRTKHQLSLLLTSPYFTSSNPHRMKYFGSVSFLDLRAIAHVQEDSLSLVPEQGALTLFFGGPGLLGLHPLLPPDKLPVGLLARADRARRLLYTACRSDRQLNMWGGGRNGEQEKRREGWE